MEKRSLFRVLLPLILLGTVGGSVHAQGFPVKPIKIVVPVPPGGTIDTMARIIGERLQAKWGQPVIVENRAGASGNIGAEYVFNAPGDGYTLLLSPPGPLAINKALYKKLGYDQQAFVPITVVTANPNVLLVHPNVPARTLAELISLAKANPGKFNYASSGPLTYMDTEMFKRMAGVDLFHVPYKAAPTAFADLLGGQVDVMFQGLVTALPQIKDGKLRVLAVASEKRYPGLPDVPALSEFFPGFVSVTWNALVAPPKTPSAIVNRIYGAIIESLKGPAAGSIKGLESRDLILNSPVEAGLFLQEETKRWAQTVRTTGATVE